MVLYTCTKCKKEKEESEFRVMTGKMREERIRPVRYWCRDCEKSYIGSPQNKSLAATRAKREREKHPKKIWAKSSINQHLRRNFDVKITWVELLKMANEVDVCPICGCEFDWGTKKDGKAIQASPSLDRYNNDRIITKKNSWIICHYCNMAKGEKTMEEFYEYCENILKRRTL